MKQQIFILEDNEERIKSFKATYHDCDLTITTTAQEAINVLDRISLLVFDLITLDHDLGGEVYCQSDEKSGYQVAKFLSARMIPCPVIIHSWNPVGAKNMLRALPEACIIPFDNKRHI